IVCRTSIFPKSLISRRKVLDANVRTARPSSITKGTNFRIWSKFVSGLSKQAKLVVVAELRKTGGDLWPATMGGAAVGPSLSHANSSWSRQIRVCCASVSGLTDVPAAATLIGTQEKPNTE